MRVLITGVTGLVGQHIVERLSQEKSLQLILLSNKRQSGCSCSTLQIDLNQKSAESLLVATAPELIVHCAAKIPTATISAESAAKVNKNIDTLIYNVAEESGADVIFISSIALYENTLSPWSEVSLLRPTNIYAKQKLESEKLFSQLNSSSVSLRISSPYGGQQSANRNVLYKFIHAAKREEALIVMGSGKRCQDFICGVDIAEAVWKVISIVISGEKLRDIFNIANGSSISMRELAMLIVEVVGGGKVIHPETEEEPGVIDFRVDINKAKLSLGWQPKITIRDGVAALTRSLGGLE